jgi:hypothetical protein
MGSLSSTTDKAKSGMNGQQSNRLFARHLADLRRSGLSDEQIAVCEFHSLHGRNDATRIAEILGWKSWPSKGGDVLVIPFFNANGTWMPYVRLKPDNPVERNSNAPKYESP